VDGGDPNGSRERRVRSSGRLSRSPANRGATVARCQGVAPGLRGWPPWPHERHQPLFRRHSADPKPLPNGRRKRGTLKLYRGELHSPADLAITRYVLNQQGDKPRMFRLVTAGVAALLLGLLVGVAVVALKGRPPPEPAATVEATVTRPSGAPNSASTATSTERVSEPLSVAAPHAPVVASPPAQSTATSRPAIGPSAAPAPRPSSAHAPRKSVAADDDDDEDDDDDC
jgi:hypothetical protein